MHALSVECAVIFIYLHSKFPVRILLLIFRIMGSLCFLTVSPLALKHFFFSVYFLTHLMV